MTDPEIKNLLSRALGDEPPLGIDRDEVFRRGRKRLRTRRMFEAGGVVTAVVVAAVGAALLTGVVGEPEKMPPAASSTVEQPAPPGPTLPLTPPPPTTGTTDGNPPSSQPVYPGSQERARELTGLLLEARALGVDGVSAVPGQDSLGFEVVDGSYVFEADVENGQSEGAIFVSVSPGPPGGTAGCDSIPEPKFDCEMQIVGGQVVSVATWRDKNTGEKRYLAHTVQPDGSTVSVIATNMSEKQRDSGNRPPTWTPVIDRDSVAGLAALPGLTYS